MRIKFKTMICGPFGVYRVGDVADLPEEIAINYIPELAERVVDAAVAPVEVVELAAFVEPICDEAVCEPKPEVRERLKLKPKK